MHRLDKNIQSYSKTKSGNQATLLWGLIVFLGLTTSLVWGREHQKLNIHPREEHALSGTAFAKTVESMDLAEREQAILNEIQKGNIPEFLRELVAIQFSTIVGGEQYNLKFFCMPDYLSIGSDSDYFLIPMTPMLAQKVVDQLGGMLPTRKMVNLVWKAGALKLTPQPIPPSSAMVTVDVFREHNAMVLKSRAASMAAFPLGSLVVGHKKDVVLSNRIFSKPDKVTIYGWHYPSGKTIQPLYSGHINWYTDYSHGIRVVLNTCLVNGVTRKLSEIVADPDLYELFSDEVSAMETTRYDTSQSNYP